MALKIHQSEEGGGFGKPDPDALVPTTCGKMVKRRFTVLAGPDLKGVTCRACVRSEMAEYERQVVEASARFHKAEHRMDELNALNGTGVE